MNKFIYIIKGFIQLIKKHKLYFLIPLLIIIAILALLAVYIGPAVQVSFIYAGI